MDFFADQARYRRRSHWLVALFVLAVLSVIAIVDLVVVWVCHFCAMFLMVADNTLSWSALVTLDVVLLVAIAGASVYRIITLRGGGSVVAMGMGATPVPAGTDDPVWRRLRNVVEEVAVNPTCDTLTLRPRVGLVKRNPTYAPDRIQRQSSPSTRKPGNPATSVLNNRANASRSASHGEAWRQ